MQCELEPYLYPVLSSMFCFVFREGHRVKLLAILSNSIIGKDKYINKKSHQAGKEVWAGSFVVERRRKQE